MTSRLYFENQYLRRFDAIITATIETENGPAVSLDRTAFYPSSGGQPHDIGKINDIPVIDVWENDEILWHLLERKPDTSQVIGLVNWEHRFDNMQQHSGQHILSTTFSEEINANTLGFHIGKESSTIDLDISKLSKDDIFRIEEKANQIVWDNLIVKTFFITEKEVDSIPFRKKPQVSGNIRVISIKDFDVSACGGTHVRSTGEIGFIKIINTERYKGGIRTTFICGKRALYYFQRILNITQQICVDLSIHLTDLPKTFTRMEEEANQNRRSLKHLRKQILQDEADHLWNDSVEIDKVKPIINHWEDRTIEEIHTIAKRLREYPKTIILLGTTDGDFLRVICTRTSDLNTPNAGDIIKEITQLLGGRGGGSPLMAQGGAPKNEHQVIIDIFKITLQKYL